MYNDLDTLILRWGSRIALGFLVLAGLLLGLAIDSNLAVTGVMALLSLIFAIAVLYQRWKLRRLGEATKRAI